MAQYFVASLESADLSVQEKKFKIDFQDDSHDGHFGFPIVTILAILIYKSPRCFQPSVKSTGHLVQDKKPKLDFHSGHFGFQIGTILAIFDLQVTPMLLTKFQVNWPFSSEEEAKNRFSDFQISDQIDFS